MKVVLKEVAQCKSGDILAADVFNERGVIFAAKDTVINDYIIERFIDHGIEKVRLYIFSSEFDNIAVKYEEFKRNYLNTILNTKDLLQDITAGKPLDYQKVSDISTQIHKNINNNENIVKCLGEIRSSDEYTYSHCVNTAVYSMLIAKWLELDKNEINKIIQAGLLHDIGKTKIPKELLCKKEKITNKEYEILKTHTIEGYEIVKEISELDHDIKKAVLLHHERMDGSGYPSKAKYENINLYSRIISVADVFDAMTSDRVYKKKATPFDAFEMFQTIGFGLFDAQIINVFLNGIATYLVGSKVQLSDGHMGEIVYIPLNNMSCPIIKSQSVLLDLAYESSTKIIRMI